MSNSYIIDTGNITIKHWGKCISNYKLQAPHIHCVRQDTQLHRVQIEPPTPWEKTRVYTLKGTYKTLRRNKVKNLNLSNFIQARNLMKNYSQNHNLHHAKYNAPEGKWWKFNGSQWYHFLWGAALTGEILKESRETQTRYIFRLWLYRYKFSL